MIAVGRLILCRGLDGALVDGGGPGGSGGCCGGRAVGGGTKLLTMTLVDGIPGELGKCMKELRFFVGGFSDSRSIMSCSGGGGPGGNGGCCGGKAVGGGTVGGAAMLFKMNCDGGGPGGKGGLLSA